MLSMELLEKHPKSFFKLKAWKPLVNNRDLYDFFDENGIYIRLDFEFSEEGLEWAYYINKRESKTTHIGDYYNSRTEAEEQAFNKAFEILESKL